MGDEGRVVLERQEEATEIVIVALERRHPPGLCNRDECTFCPADRNAIITAWWTSVPNRWAFHRA